MSDLTLGQSLVNEGNPSQVDMLSPKARNLTQSDWKKYQLGIPTVLELSEQDKVSLDGLVKFRAENSLSITPFPEEAYSDGIQAIW